MEATNELFVPAHHGQTVVTIRDKGFRRDRYQLTPENVQYSGHRRGWIVQDKVENVHERQNLSAARLKLEKLSVEDFTQFALFRKHIPFVIARRLQSIALEFESICRNN